MAWLKAYEWEREKFPMEHQINILPQYRIPLAQKLLKRFGVYARVALTTHGKGLAYIKWAKEIHLGKPGYQCTLGTIYHEIAHIRNGQEGEKGHTGSFKRFLIHTYVDGNLWLKEIMKEVFEEVNHQKIEAQKVVEKEIKKAENKVQAVAYRKTRGYRIEKTVKRISKLERRIKTLNTRLKSAKRSLGALQRAEVRDSKRAIVEHPETRQIES